MWKYAGCAVQGRGRIDKNVPCQDMVFGLSDTDCSVMALADGAGSAKLSHYGAKLAVKTICDYAKNNFDRWYATNNAIEVKQEIIQFLTGVMDKEAVERNCALTDLACTLLFVIVKDEKYIICHVGDGVVGYIKDGEIKVASAPFNGEFANQTFFITSPNAVKDMKLIKGQVKNIETFVLMSDGSEACLYSKAKNYLAPAIQKFATMTLAYRQAFMEDWLKDYFIQVISQKTFDDCSIAILTKVNFIQMDYAQKCVIFGLEPKVKQIKNQLDDYTHILEITKSSQGIKVIAKKAHIRLSKVRRIVAEMLDKDLLMCERSGNYRSNVDV